jgi:hypothetical protein
MADAKGPLITRVARMIARLAFDGFILNCSNQHGMFARQKKNLSAMMTRPGTSHPAIK